MTERKIRLGFAGTGRIARSVHLAGFQRLADRVEMVSAFDIDADRVAQAAKDFGIPHVYTNFEEMLDGPALDAITICTPPNAHAPLTIQAFARGLHVLCEKPAALASADAIEMVRAARRADRVLMIGFQNRFSRACQALKRIIDDGALGEIYYARAQSLRRRGLPGWGMFTSKEMSGGGPMMDIGVHALDRMVYLLGNPTPVTVFGATYQKLATRPGFNAFGPWDPAKVEVEDFATAQVRFANGATLLLEASWMLNISSSASSTLLCGTEGGAELEPFKVYTEQHGMLFDMALPDGVWRGPESIQTIHDAKLAHFIDCIEQGSRPIVTPAEIVSVVQILEAVYQSAETGQAVTIAAPEL
ncbi:MAG TPA: Gfo/Idh/MocA family oxidoreductase [Chloroflexota bacterium]|nr:Gfo/Idh/MocA family oxidoreductase [Chloroflexota bacterium]